MKKLAAKKCTPCSGKTPPLKGAELKTFHKQLGHEWKVTRARHLEKEYKFKDFKEALAFTNQVGALAEAENHHPDIVLSWGKVGVVLWTHAIDGLSESDFIMAAKIESLPRKTLKKN